MATDSLLVTWREREAGPACPHCGGTRSLVIETRAGPARRYNRRRRQCEACGRRYTTREHRIVELEGHQGRMRAVDALLGAQQATAHLGAALLARSYDVPAYLEVTELVRTALECLSAGAPPEQRQEERDDG